MVEMERLIRLAEKSAFGPSTQAILDEAASRDIPYIRLDRHSLVQLGQGVHQQRIRATMTSKTSAIGVDIASDKSLTNRLLDSAGLPVPQERRRHDRGGDGRGRPPDRLPVRRQAARRQPRPGRPPRPALRRGGPGRVRRRARPEPERRPRRRELRRGQRLSLPRDRRQVVAAIAERVPASVTGDGEHTDPPARRDRQPGSAPGHRPREGPDPDQGRCRRRGARRASRASRSTTSRPRARSSSSP